MTSLCACGNTKETWQDCCKSCYAQRMRGSKKQPTAGNRDVEIRRQVFLKVASHQLEGKQPKDVVAYAKQLESEFVAWT